MDFIAHCPFCNARFNATEEHIGRPGKCQRCNKKFTITDPDEQNPEAFSIPEIPISSPPESDDEQGQSSLSDAITSASQDSYTVRPLVSPPFSVLKLMVILYAGLAALSIIIGVIVSMWFWVNQDLFIPAALSFAVGVGVALPLFLISELIQLMLQFETNTNHTANSNEQMRSILANRL